MSNEDIKNFRASSILGEEEGLSNLADEIREHDVTCDMLAASCTMLRMLTTLVGERNKKAGWRNDLVTGEPRVRSPSELVALAHTELSEAYEGFRRGERMDDKLTHRKQEEVELADAIYRILDWAEERGLDIGGAFAEKMAFNMVRDDHKREQRLADGGKKL